MKCIVYYICCVYFRGYTSIVVMCDAQMLQYFLMYIATLLIADLYTKEKTERCLVQYRHNSMCMYSSLLCQLSKLKICYLCDMLHSA